METIGPTKLPRPSPPRLPVPTSPPALTHPAPRPVPTPPTIPTEALFVGPTGPPVLQAVSPSGDVRLTLRKYSVGDALDSPHLNIRLDLRIHLLHPQRRVLRLPHAGRPSPPALPGPPRPHRPGHAPPSASPPSTSSRHRSPTPPPPPGSCPASTGSTPLGSATSRISHLSAVSPYTMRRTAPSATGTTARHYLVHPRSWDTP